MRDNREVNIGDLGVFTLNPGSYEDLQSMSDADWSGHDVHFTGVLTGILTISVIRSENISVGFIFTSRVRAER